MQHLYFKTLKEIHIPLATQAPPHCTLSASPREIAEKKTIPPMAKSGALTLNIPGRHPDAVLILQYVEQNSLSFKLRSWTKLDNFKDEGVTLDQRHKCYYI